MAYRRFGGGGATGSWTRGAPRSFPTRSGGRSVGFRRRGRRPFVRGGNFHFTQGYNVNHNTDEDSAVSFYNPILWAPDWFDKQWDASIGDVTIEGNFDATRVTGGQFTVDIWTNTEVAGVQLLIPCIAGLFISTLVDTEDDPLPAAYLLRPPPNLFYRTWGHTEKFAYGMQTPTNPSISPRVIHREYCLISSGAGVVASNSWRPPRFKWRQPGFSLRRNEALCFFLQAYNSHLETDVVLGAVVAGHFGYVHRSSDA